MKLLNKIFICALLLPSLLSCKKEKAEEWFVIEKNGSMRDSLCSLNGDGFFSTIKSEHQIRNKKPQKGELSPSYIIPVQIHTVQNNWYFDIQFIIDSNNTVYVYQIERRLNGRFIKHFTDNNQSNPLFSNYIGLRPEHLLAFDSKYFVDFLKANNDIFGFDINDRDSAFMAVIATTTDTIKNPVLYQLRDLIKGSMSKTFLIRKTSEEENVVLYHKRRHIPFHPEQWRWSTHFLDGKHRPFTSSYDSLERNTAVVFKAAPGIKRQIKRMRHIQ